MLMAFTFDVIGFSFIDPHALDATITALHRLNPIGALDNDENFASLGRTIGEFPLQPLLAKVLIASRDLGRYDTAVIVVVVLSVGSFPL